MEAGSWKIFNSETIIYNIKTSDIRLLTSDKNHL